MYIVKTFYFDSERGIIPSEDSQKFESYNSAKECLKDILQKWELILKEDYKVREGAIKDIYVIEEYPKRYFQVGIYDSSVKVW